MYMFIILLRAIAACLITNSHYTNVYPISALASGGLLGDVIFFAVSGFCLANINSNFFVWMKKRIIRIYPSVWIISIIFILLGYYCVNADNNLFFWLVYPTYYHFVASISILYIPYYFVAKMNDINKTKKVGFIVLIIWICIYMFLYDKSYYHIDNVREPIIRIFFFESMMIGLYFRQMNFNVLKNNIKTWFFILFFAVLYFGSKIVFSNIDSLSNYQIANQIILLVLLFFLFKCFGAVEVCIEKINKKIFRIIEYISKHTLEIYLVQYVIIGILEKRIIFPFNWIIISILIIFCAVALKYCTTFLIEFVKKGCDIK